MRHFLQSAFAAAVFAYLCRLFIGFLSTGVVYPVSVDRTLQPALLLWVAGLVIAGLIFLLRGFRSGHWPGGAWIIAVIVFAALDYFGLLQVPTIDFGL